jgi:hypothetical protein
MVVFCALGSLWSRDSACHSSVWDLKVPLDQLELLVFLELMGTQEWMADLETEGLMGWMEDKDPQGHLDGMELRVYLVLRDHLEWRVRLVR